MTPPTTTRGGQSPTQSSSDAAAAEPTGEITTTNSPSDPIQSSAEGSSPSVSSSSPSRSGSTSYGLISSSLAKSNSVASAGQRSIASHISVSAIGTIPLGGLQLHRPSEPQPLDEEPPPPPPKCLENGDVFLILDLPRGFTVGIDTLAVTADSANVPGFRDIPPGPHFLWVSEPGSISRCGYWFVTGTQGETRVKQWDRYNEVLGEVASNFEVLNQKENIDETYPRLIPHNYQGGRFDTSGPPPPPPKDGPPRGSWPSGSVVAHDSAFMWRQLTSAVSPAFLNRITGRKNVSEWLVDTSDSPKGDISFPGPTKLLKAVAGSELRFVFPQDAVDLDLLRISSGTSTPTDATSRILALLDNVDNSDGARRVAEADIIGELQFTFLTGMHIGNYSCLDQWWYLILKVVLRAHRLAIDRPILCRTLLQTLHAQLVYSDRYIARGDNEEQEQQSGTPAAAGSDPDSGGILDTVPHNRRRMRAALALYIRRLDELSVNSDVKTTDRASVGLAFADLEAWCSRYGWDLRDGEGDGGGVGDEGADEDDDYAPVVVELDGEGREIGLVRWD